MLHAGEKTMDHPLWPGVSDTEDLPQVEEVRRATVETSGKIAEALEARLVVRLEPKNRARAR